MQLCLIVQALSSQIEWIMAITVKKTDREYVIKVPLVDALRHIQEEQTPYAAQEPLNEDVDVELDAFSEYELERNKPMPSLNHSLIQSNILVRLSVNYGKHYRFASELSLILGDWNCVPDISILPYAPIDSGNDAIKVARTPLCVVEILSPTQSQTELLDKARQYFKHGVPSVWIVFPELQNVYVFTSPTDYEIYRVGATLVDSALGIEVEVAPFFE